MANNPNTTDTPSINGAASGGGKDYAFIRERLEHDAERVTDKDIDRLNTSLPRKLAGKVFGEGGSNLQWVQTIADRAVVLFDMIRDPGYKLSRKAKTLIAAGLIYLVLPTDMAPDIIPGIGYIDDALVLSTLWKVLESEIDSFMAFRGSTEAER